MGVGQWGGRTVLIKLDLLDKCRQIPDKVSIYISPR